MDTNKAKLIDKIKKLLALSKSPNENEAARAAEKVQELLAEHNLSMSTVTESKDKGSGIITDTELTTTSRAWRRQVANAVAAMYFSQYGFATRPTLRKKAGAATYRKMDVHFFIGEEHNVAVAKEMFTYLCRTIDRLANEAVKEVTTNRNSFKRSFQHGCTSRVSARIAQRIADAKAGRLKTAGGTNLPALLDLYDSAKAKITEHIKKEHGEFKPKKQRTKASNLKGLFAGIAAGDKIGLDTQVGGEDAKPKLNGAKERDIASIKPRPEFLTAFGKNGKPYVGIVTDDGRCRVDYHGDLSDLIFYETAWIDPRNPWGGGRTGAKVTGLRADYT